MNTSVSRSFLLVAAVLAAAFSSADQMIQNGNFGIAAGSLNHWTHSGSITDNSGTTAHDFITTTSSRSHSTRFSADMNLENFSNSSFHAEMEQTFNPVAASGVSEISLWAFSFDQDLRVNLLYSDNTSTSVTKHFNLGQQEATDPNHGWEKWDLLGSLDTTKMLKGIRIGADSGFLNAGNNILVDDVSIQAVPEPTTMTALALGGLGLLKRRRRA